MLKAKCEILIFGVMLILENQRKHQQDKEDEKTCNLLRVRKNHAQYKRIAIARTKQTNDEVNMQLLSA